MLTRRALCASAGALALAATPGSAATLPAPRRKLLFDTDIGSDIDDAVALAYLLRQPACELLGITTVTGDASGRAALAQTLCSAAGRDVPVYAGVENPLQVAQRQREAPQTRRLRSDGPRPAFPRGAAIDFLRETIRAHPGEVTLLAVGPFTNVATLFEIDPELPALLGALVIMGGKYSDYPTPWGPTEWNAIVDPHATAAIFAAQPRSLTAFGLDITWQVSMGPEEVAARFRGDPLLELVLDWSSVWFEERDQLHFHDPLAAVWLWEPGICELLQGNVDVELTPGARQGVTRFTAARSGPVRVARSVNPERFFEAYFSVFKGDWGAFQPPETPVDSLGGRL